MKVVNCVWELQNLDEKVVEISIELDDVFNREEILRSSEGYDYVVIKVPVGKVDFNFGLASLGYICIETQFHVRKRISQFNPNDKMIRVVSRGLSFRDVCSNSAIEEVYSRISDGMFKTDRIVLDTHYGPKQGRKRYVNWMRSMMGDGAIVYEILSNGEAIGFSFLKVSDDNKILDYILGGIYEPFQSRGWGLLTPASPLLYSNERNLPFESVDTHISSNNSVFYFYNYLSYSVRDMSYVFIKHNQ